MESDDDYQTFSQPSIPSSPVHPKKLKRLKKAIRVSSTSPIPKPSDPIPSSNGSQSWDDSLGNLLETLGFDDGGGTEEIDCNYVEDSRNVLVEEFDVRDGGLDGKMKKLSELDVEEGAKSVQNAKLVALGRLVSESEGVDGEMEKPVDLVRSVLESEGFDGGMARPVGLVRSVSKSQAFDGEKEKPVDSDSSVLGLEGSDDLTQGPEGLDVGQKLGDTDTVIEELVGKVDSFSSGSGDQILDWKLKKLRKKRGKLEKGDGKLSKSSLEEGDGKLNKSAKKRLNLEEGDGKRKKSAKKRLCAEEGDEKKGKKRCKGDGESWELEEGEGKAKKSVKKRLNLEEGEENVEKKSKKRGKSVGDNEKVEVSIRTKKRLEKERKAHLEKLHAESQRLLRETRDATFKPAPAVRKPISSVLEKIRRRKLEVLREAGIIDKCGDNNNCPREDMIDLNQDEVSKHELEKEKHIYENKNQDGIRVESSSSSEPVSFASQHESAFFDTALDESKTPFRTPINDTQDLFSGSEQSDNEDLQSDSQEDSPVEEVFVPSMLAMSLKLDSAPDDDFDDEEDNDKENLDPQSDKLVHEDLNAKGDPVKAFVDDEAEEEDDSDNDLMRFGDYEEEGEHDDIEELKDLIVIGYKEKPIDNKMRDQLHQKWLEQQDAAATDNVLQRLKCGFKHKESTSVDEEEEEEEDLNEDSLDEAANDLHPKNVTRINSKKVKQMIPQMFTEKNEAYLSSDDEETEQKLAKQRLLEKAQEEHTSFLSPADDESSRGVFGLIKKLNVAPDTKKRAKSSSFFDMLSTGGNSNSLSKSSFLGRASSNSLPSSRKNGSSNFRSFIFGRDDSNSRTGITTLDASPDVGEKENRPVRPATTKFSKSQFKFSSQRTSTTKTSASSLLEVLRRSSMQSDHCTRSNLVGQTQAVVQFAAFKSTKKSIKIEAGI